MFSERLEDTLVDTLEGLEFLYPVPDCIMSDLWFNRILQDNGSGEMMQVI